MNHYDNIKIVYSWLGPKGPIWNTELPNILTFSAAADGTRSESPYFWCDDLWHRLFRFKKEHYILYPASEINRKDMFIYPFSLAWRIQFNNYFLGRTGILEYSHTGGHIIDNVRNGNGFFLIDLSVEAFVQEDQIAAMHQYFRTIHHLPLHKVIYLTGAMNANELYEEYCARRNIPNEPHERLNIISYPSSQNVYSTHINEGFLQEPNYDVNTVPEKVFLCYNRRFRSHRTNLALALDKEGIVDRSYYSMGLHDPESLDKSFKQTVDLYGISDYELNSHDVNRFVAKLPLVIDNKSDIVEMCEDRDMAARPFYTNSLVSLVTETNFNLPEVTLTEKSFKPIKEKHPFIIVGVPGSIKALQSIGFKTFNEFWPENYDTITNPKARLNEIIHICKDIANWTPEKILDFKRRVKPILDHNYQILKIRPTESLSEKLAALVRKYRK